MAAKIPCSYCKKSIDAAASRCPYCQGEYSPEQVAARTKNAKNTMAIGCVGLLVLAGLVGMCSSEEPKVAESAAPLPEQGSASKDIEARVFGFNKAVSAAMKQCDGKASEMAELIGKIQKGNASVYDGFSMAKTTEDACHSSWSAVREISIPDGLPDSGKEAAEKMRDACGKAMMGKKMSAATMAEIFDGEMRPSKVEEMKTTSNAAGAATLACAAGMFSLGAATGVDVTKINAALK